MHSQQKAIVITRGAHGDLSAAAVRGNAVADCILHNRLQKELWNGCIENLRRRFHAEAQAAAEAHLLNGQVALKELEFLAERNLLPIDIAQRHAQKVTQQRRHLLRGFAVGHLQGGDGVQRVEKEVRVKLHLERGQVGVGQLRLQLRGSQLTLLKASVVKEGLGGGDSHGISKHGHQKVLHIPVVQVGQQ